MGTETLTLDRPDLMNKREWLAQTFDIELPALATPEVEPPVDTPLCVGDRVLFDDGGTLVACEVMQILEGGANIVVKIEGDSQPYSIPADKAERLGHALRIGDRVVVDDGQAAAWIGTIVEYAGTTRCAIRPESDSDEQGVFAVEHLSPASGPVLPRHRFRAGNRVLITAEGLMHPGDVVKVSDTQVELRLDGVSEVATAEPDWLTLLTHAWRIGSRVTMQSRNGARSFGEIVQFRSATSFGIMLDGSERVVFLPLAQIAPERPEPAELEKSWELMAEGASAPPEVPGFDGFLASASHLTALAQQYLRALRLVDMPGSPMHQPMSPRLRAFLLGVDCLRQQGYQYLERLRNWR